VNGRSGRVDALVMPAARPRSTPLVLLALLSLLLGLGLGVHHPATAATAVPSVSVVGDSLRDASGRPVRLLGVNRAGTEYACAQGWGTFDGPTDATAVSAIAAWHVNAVRVPLNESCWLGINGVSPTYGGAAYRDAITAWVGRLHAAGLLAVLDLHWNAPGTTLATGQQVMADADHAPAFWTSVATAFHNDPGVVFDLYNEPHDISWACWRDGCTTTGGCRAPVIADGNQWGGDLSSWLSHQPVDPAGQLVAGLHEYSFGRCTTSACWDTEIAPVAALVPVVTGELGEDDCGGSFVTAFLQWADAHGLSYLGWTWNTWDCKTGPALISAWDGTPTAFGAALQSHLAALATVPVGATPATASPTPGAGATCTGRSRHCRLLSRRTRTRPPLSR
jgi:endoglucanase